MLERYAIKVKARLIRDGRDSYFAAVVRLLPTLLNVAFSVPDVLFRLTTMQTLTTPAMSAYSSAVAPPA
jgi:hypothetical protein